MCNKIIFSLNIKIVSISLLYRRRKNILLVTKIHNMGSNHIKNTTHITEKIRYCISWLAVEIHPKIDNRLKKK